MISAVAVWDCINFPCLCWCRFVFFFCSSFLQLCFVFSSMAFFVSIPMPSLLPLESFIYAATAATCCRRVNELLFLFFFFFLFCESKLFCFMDDDIYVRIIFLLSPSPPNLTNYFKGLHCYPRWLSCQKSRLQIINVNFGIISQSGENSIDFFLGFVSFFCGKKASDFLSL